MFGLEGRGRRLLIAHALLFYKYVSSVVFLFRDVITLFTRRNSLPYAITGDLAILAL